MRKPATFLLDQQLLNDMKVVAKADNRSTNNWIETKLKEIISALKTKKKNA
jgi:hypothetical protein